MTQIGSKEYPDVELTHMYVDNAAMQLIRNPKQVRLCLSGSDCHHRSLLPIHWYASLTRL